MHAYDRDETERQVQRGEGEVETKQRQLNNLSAKLLATAAREFAWLPREGAFSTAGRPGTGPTTLLFWAMIPTRATSRAAFLEACPRARNLHRKSTAHFKLTWNLKIERRYSASAPNSTVQHYIDSGLSTSSASQLYIRHAFHAPSQSQCSHAITVTRKLFAKLAPMWMWTTARLCPVAQIRWTTLSTGQTMYSTARMQPGAHGACLCSICRERSCLPLVALYDSPTKTCW